MAAITTRITSGTGATVKNAPLSSTEIDNNFIGLNTELVLKSPINNPYFTGEPSAPTAAVDTASPQLATTQFVINQQYLKQGVAASVYLSLTHASSTYALKTDPVTTGSFFHTGTLLVSGDINATGDITTAYSSDRNLKTEIQVIKDALSKVKQLHGITYAWNELSGKDMTIREAGVLAQDVLVVQPESVVTRENGYLAVRYEQLSALIIEAIKELSDKVDQLETKVNGI